MAYNSDKLGISAKREPDSHVASLAHQSGCEDVSINFSGEAGIRTLGRISPTSVFETDVLAAEVACGTTTSGTLAFPCVPGCVPTDSELTKVVEAWPYLPPHTRLVILTLVDSVSTTRKKVA